MEDGEGRMSDLIKHDYETLPDTIEELNYFVKVGTEEIKAHKAVLKALQEAGASAEYFKDRLAHAQDRAEMVIEAMVRMGILIESEGEHRGGKSDRSSIGGTSNPLPKGIDKKQSHYAQEIAKHPLVVAAMKLYQRERKILLTWNQVYRAIKKPPAPIPEIEGIYRIVYADPPWKYGNMMPDGTTEPSGEYPLMTIDEICQIDMKGHTEKNAVLFLWVTWPILEESFQVVKAWGFKYKTGWCWDKVKHNMGHYSSVRSELLLLGIKGSLPLENKKLFDNVVSIERNGHSEKPQYFREMIDTIYPSGKALEVFYRGDKSKLGERWNAIGNEIS